VPWFTSQTANRLRVKMVCLSVGTLALSDVVMMCSVGWFFPFNLVPAFLLSFPSMLLGTVRPARLPPVRPLTLPPELC
jgi:hypothetical protein